MIYTIPDYYTRKAKREGFLARSVYKLMEIDQKFFLFHIDDIVLDLGASPGSWSQYISNRVGRHGLVISINLFPVKVYRTNIKRVQGDINTIDMESMLQEYDVHQFNAIVSDMAPNTTGNKFLDQQRSYELALKSYQIARQYLKPDGNFLCKLFNSDERKQLIAELETTFENVRILQPKAIRTNSKELYVLGKNILEKNKCGE